MDRKREVSKVLAAGVREILDKSGVDFERLQEIRLRVGQPLIIRMDDKNYFLTEEGHLSDHNRQAYLISASQLKETLEYVSSYSLYAFEDEIRQGFITIQGGHRVGLAGRVVIKDGAIKTMKHITFLNIRLSHEVKGCAGALVPYLEEDRQLKHTLILSGPGGGKTTLLRDLIRLISDGELPSGPYHVGVVDERSELGACYMGVPQNDLGVQSDVLDCCPKALGMMMLVRTMSPQVIAVDEIGSLEDVNAMHYAMSCGCSLLATVHGNSLEELQQKPVFASLLNEKAFERYIVLNRKKAGKITAVYDKSGHILYSPGQQLTGREV